MLDVGLASQGQPRAFQSTDAELKTVLRHDLLREALEVRNQALESAYTLGTYRLELRVAREDNH